MRFLGVMLHGAVPTVGASSLASAEHVETVFVKEGLEWRRGGVQGAWTEW